MDPPSIPSTTRRYGPTEGPDAHGNTTATWRVSGERRDAPGSGERGLDPLDRGCFGLVAALRGLAHGLRELEDEAAIAVELVGRLRSECGDGGPQGLVRFLDLARRRDRPEAGAVLRRELPHELAVVLARVDEVVRERGCLLERVEDAPVAHRDEQPGTGRALAQLVPLLLGEICLAGHPHLPFRRPPECLRTRFRMTLRCRGVLGGAMQGRRESRYAGISGRPRTPQRAAQRDTAAQGFILKRVLTGPEAPCAGCAGRRFAA